MQWYERKTSLAEERPVQIAMTGTGAAAPTKRYGQGVTITRTGVGVYRLTFKEQLGKFVGLRSPCFGADAMNAVKGYSISRGAYSAANKYIDISLWDSANAAVDLAASQYLELEILFTALSTAS